MKKLLSGTYSLISHGTYDNANKFTPTNIYIKGEIRYSDDGSMSVIILLSEEPKLIDEILCYVGTYKVTSENTVEHRISLSSSSKLSNTVEERTYILDEDTLVLGKKLSEQKRFEAVWKRVK